MNMTTVDQHRAVVQRFDAILNTGDIDQIDELCTADMHNHSLAPARPPGLEGTRQYLATSGRLFRNEVWTSSIVVCEDDYVVQFGTRSGEFPGGPYFGFELRAGSYARDASFMYRLQNGQIAERWAVRDDLGFIRQLGGL